MKSSYFSYIPRGTSASGRFAATASVLLFLLLISTSASAKTYYLDGNLAQNCAGNYSVANRSCSGADGYAYNTIQDAIAALASGDTMYVRAGTYIRTTNSTTSGALNVSVSGTPTQRTVVSAYGSEQPVICTAAGKCQYNANPGDTSFTNSSRYYPNPAIIVGGNYIDIVGLKTYGQVLIYGAHDSTVKRCDLGGGGPYINQGQVVMIHSSYNITIQNNKIHNSSWGESDLNGAALMGYKFAATIENNEFYDNWGPDIKLKDTAGQSGKTTVIRYNFFRPSSFTSNSGFNGIIQYADIDYVYVHNNIFYNKSIGVSWDGSSRLGTFVYNNTFINCNTDIFQWIPNMTVKVFNNLHYHTTSGKMNYNLTTTALSSDYNLFYSSTGDTVFYNGGNGGSTLASWRSFSGKDASSVAKNPNFVNPTGTRPQDFKRTSYAGDVAGSTYSTVAGAYVTGNEVVGLTSTGSSDTVPPAQPTGLIAN